MGVYIAAKRDDGKFNVAYFSDEQMQDIQSSSGVKRFTHDHIRDGVFALVLQRLKTSEEINSFMDQYLCDGVAENLWHLGAFIGIETAFTWDGEKWRVMFRLMRHYPTIDSYLS